MPRISIIGTAGRGNTGSKIDKQVYISMYNKCLSLLSDIPKEERFLISGSAAISDHLAISLFLSNNAHCLTLYLPALWDDRQHIFYGNKDANTANYYHKLFSEKMGGNTLLGIQRAIDKGATIHQIQEGFLARNIFVGHTDKLIAFGFENGSAPLNGGTAHTWRNSPCNDKIYVNISEL